jgi:hypothetical protein
MSKALAVSLAALSLAASGCLMQPSYSIKVTTAEGIEMEVPLTAKVDINVSDDVIAVKNFRYVPLSKGSEKALGYYFELQFKHGAKPVSVVIDDVSEAPILNLVTDTAPKLVRTDSWEGTSGPYNTADSHVTWLATLDNGVRVYRITAKLPDGTTDVLRLPILMPSNTKAIFRAELGIK